jgi:hypothetical protein
VRLCALHGIGRWAAPLPAGLAPAALCVLGWGLRSSAQLWRNSPRPSLHPPRSTNNPTHVHSPPCRQSCRGLVKPDIVFFGESLPPRFFELAPLDFSAADLLIVMGTSLAVQPFAGLIGGWPLGGRWVAPGWPSCCPLSLGAWAPPSSACLRVCSPPLPHCRFGPDGWCFGCAVNASNGSDSCKPLLQRPSDAAAAACRRLPPPLQTLSRTRCRAC